ncbi:MAG: ATP-binding cassette domain-containing protein [Candidatus Babeliales bacterium]
MLKVSNLSKIFHQKTILDSISFEAQKGEVLLFLGKSGVGKSTILRILANLESPDQGTIQFDGELFTPDLLIKKHLVGMVFQQFNLFSHLTILQNITLPLETILLLSPDEARKQAFILLKRFEIDTKADRYPSELSGGQKQRAALVRTLAMKPRIICLDEPTSALDPFMRTQVAHDIHNLSQEGFIVIVATHDTNLLDKLYGTLFLLEDGRIIEQCNSASFFDQQSHYPRLRHFITGKEPLI